MNRDPGLDGAMTALTAVHDRIVNERDRYFEFIQTIKVSMLRDPVLVAPFIGRLCEAALAGKTVEEAIADIGDQP